MKISHLLTYQVILMRHALHEPRYFLFIDHVAKILITMNNDTWSVIYIRKIPYKYNIVQECISIILEAGSFLFPFYHCVQSIPINREQNLKFFIKFIKDLESSLNKHQILQENSLFYVTLCGH